MHETLHLGVEPTCIILITMLEKPCISWPKKSGCVHHDNSLQKVTGLEYQISSFVLFTCVVLIKCSRHALSAASVVLCPTNIYSLAFPFFRFLFSFFLFVSNLFGIINFLLFALSCFRPSSQYGVRPAHPQYSEEATSKATSRSLSTRPDDNIMTSSLGDTKLRHFLH